MAKGLSLHVGLNSVNPNFYVDQYGKPWTGDLVACENDARSMAAMAKQSGIKTRKMLLTKAATASALITALKSAAKSLQDGDLFFLTYSGHGGQVDDLNHDEGLNPLGSRDGMDETWCMYDRDFVDDELYQLLARFKSGVRIFVISDSCHSGTVLRGRGFRPVVDGRKVRAIPPAVAKATGLRHAEKYARIQKDNPTAEKSKVLASAILISGCMDNQESLDGPVNGYFTERLLRVWDDGNFDGGYRELRNRIVAKMPKKQTPNFFVVGKANAKFEAQKPLTI